MTAASNASRFTDRQTANADLITGAGRHADRVYRFIAKQSTEEHKSQPNSIYRVVQKSGTPVLILRLLP